MAIYHSSKDAGRRPRPVPVSHIKPPEQVAPEPKKIIEPEEATEPEEITATAEAEPVAWGWTKDKATKDHVLMAGETELARVFKGDDKKWRFSLADEEMNEADFGHWRSARKAAETELVR